MSDLQHTTVMSLEGVKSTANENTNMILVKQIKYDTEMLSINGRIWDVTFQKQLKD